MLGVNKVLVESYRLIYRFIHHGGKIWMNSAIQKRVRWLYRNFGITRWEIIACMKQEFKRQDKHRKFDPKKSCLETYVLNFTYFTLLTLVRRFKKQETGGEKEIPFSQLVDFEPIKTIGHSIDSFERQGIEGLIDEENPEAILMGGELMEIASSHFGNSDLAVILGLRDKRTEARRLGMNYDAYRKRLQRKLAQFRSIISDRGYDLD
jgi:hypothetical protein